MPTRRCRLLVAGLLVLPIGAPGAETPVDVGGERQLFLDDFLLARREGVALVLHPPIAREVVLEADRPWEGGASWAASVLHDGDRYRLWYRAAPEPAPGARERWTYTAYAESRDGIRWQRPDLGLFEFEGSKHNNIVWTGPGANMSVLRDARRDVPEDERYKAIVRAGGIYGLVSRDGVRWRLVQDGHILSGGPFDSHNVVFQDPWTLEYVYYGRGFINRRTGREWVRGRDAREDLTRRIRRSTSRDFRRWTPLEFIDLGPELDELYTNAAVPYPRARGVYLMFPKRFVADRRFDPRWYDPGQSDVVFASSRDGLRWSRTFLEAFVRPGLDPGNWHDRAIAMGQGIVQTGPKELSMYYFENFHLPTCRLRRVTIRPDGFVSVNAPYRGGEFVTRPLVFRGRAFEINYATSAAGFVRVEVQDDSGRAVPSLGLGESPEIFGDELERRVSWRGGADVGALAGKPVRLRFRMKDADLFSFRFVE